MIKIAKEKIPSNLFRSNYTMATNCCSIYFSFQLCVLVIKSKLEDSQSQYRVYYLSEDSISFPGEEVWKNFLRGGLTDLITRDDSWPTSRIIRAISATLQLPRAKEIYRPRKISSVISRSLESHHPRLPNFLFLPRNSTDERSRLA